MYKSRRPSKTSIKYNESYKGETIEQKVRRVVNNKEPITDGAPLVYTERKDGVLPQYDIRSDKWEVALDAMDKVQQAQMAKRKERQDKSIGEQAREGMEKENPETGANTSDKTTG